MTNLDELRRAARGPIRRQPVKPIVTLCVRCDGEIVSRRIERECKTCALAGVQAFGSVTPIGEASGW